MVIAHRKRTQRTTELFPLKCLFLCELHPSKLFFKSNLGNFPFLLKMCTHTHTRTQEKAGRRFVCERANGGYPYAEARTQVGEQAGTAVVLRLLQVVTSWLWTLGESLRPRL